MGAILTINKDTYSAFKMNNLCYFCEVCRYEKMEDGRWKM